MDTGIWSVVSWHREGELVAFWDGTGWGAGDQAKFFKTMLEAYATLKKVTTRPAGEGFQDPNVLDVAAFNVKFGKSIGPRPEVWAGTADHLRAKR